MNFKELGLCEQILESVDEKGYKNPTEIQKKAIPHILMGRDVLGCAQSGTGKTGSFVMPLIEILSSGKSKSRMPRSLILAPTRELAMQVSEEFNLLNKHLKLQMALLIGGVSFTEQDNKITKGVDVLIATPGRLLDHIERGKVLIKDVKILIIDEADRMLDMGFIPDIERIFKLTPFTRQTLFFSATMAPEIERITNTFLSNPIRVEVSRQATASETISQELYKTVGSKKINQSKEKRDLLRVLIEQEGEQLTNGIIFCNRKTDVDIVHKSLKKHGYNSQCIHGDLGQIQRTKTLDGFRDGSVRLLVASDVAARGLDIPSVSHVFNYDVPNNAEDYVHRIGRTGRAGRKGKAMTISTPKDEKLIEAINGLTGSNIPIRNINVVEKSRPLSKINKGQKEEKSKSASKQPIKKLTKNEKTVNTNSSDPKSPEKSKIKDLEEEFSMPNFITLSFQERQ